MKKKDRKRLRRLDDADGVKRGYHEFLMATMPEAIKNAIIDRTRKEK